MLCNVYLLTIGLDTLGDHFALGEIYSKTSIADEAEKKLKLALKEDPYHPMASYYLGQLLLREQKAKEAFPLLQVSVQSDPKFMLAHLEMGKCYLALGNLDEAVRALTKVAELEPGSKEPHYLLARVYARLNDDSKMKYHEALYEKLSKAEKSKGLKVTENALKK